MVPLCRWRGASVGLEVGVSKGKERTQGGEDSEEGGSLKGDGDPTGS